MKKIISVVRVRNSTYVDIWSQYSARNSGSKPVGVVKIIWWDLCALIVWFCSTLKFPVPFGNSLHSALAPYFYLAEHQWLPVWWSVHNHPHITSFAFHFHGVSIRDRCNILPLRAVLGHLYHSACRSVKPVKYYLVKSCNSSKIHIYPFLLCSQTHPCAAEELWRDQIHKFSHMVEIAVCEGPFLCSRHIQTNFEKRIWLRRFQIYIKID